MLDMFMVSFTNKETYSLLSQIVKSENPKNLQIRIEYVII